MVVIVLSNTLGSKLCIATSRPVLMTRNRLRGISEEVYLEGTHLMVPSTLNFVGVCNRDLAIRFLGSRHPSCMTSGPSHEASPV
jgi:hypothetical protein